MILIGKPEAWEKEIECAFRKLKKYILQNESCCPIFCYDVPWETFVDNRNRLCRLTFGNARMGTGDISIFMTGVSVRRW